MARLFDDGSLQYLENLNGVVTAAPLTIAGWYFLSPAHGVAHTIATCGGAFAEYFLLVTVGNNLRFSNRSVAAGSKSAVATIDITDGVWQHACGVTSAVNARACYLNGANRGNNGATVTPLGVDQTRIGRGVYGQGNYMRGGLAEEAMWNVALTDAEVAILAAGYSPLFVRPQSLVAYHPLFGRISPEIDPVGGFDMTLVNGPTQAPHPRIIYPTAAQVRAIAAAPTGVPAHWMHYARMRNA